VKNEELWKQYDAYTTLVSENCRKLAFCAAAIDWVFRTGQSQFPNPIWISLLYLIGFFILDVMQYLVSAFCLRFWIYHEEGKQWKETQSIDGEYNKPKWIDRPAFTFFIAKIICLVLTYIFIFIHICKMA